MHKRRQQRQANILHMRVHGARLERERIAQVHQLNLRILGDDCIHHRLSIRRNKDVILSNQSPISIRPDEILPHLHMAKHAATLRRGGVTMPAAAKKFNIKFFIGHMIITVIHRRIRHEILRGCTYRIERFKTIRAVQTQDIFQEFRHAFSPFLWLLWHAHTAFI